MTIDRLSQGMILVTLMDDDMRRYSLDFNDAADGERTRRGLTRLMYRVGEECGIDHRDKCYLIEALPGKESYCLLPEYPLTSAERCILNEYGAVCRESPVTVARIREYGKLLREHSRRRRHLKYASSAAI